ncbi:prion-inhibition and propagation-domain-containing protein [Auriculariales sp. MPI-PUGE-AT-0066]|nr:prion-inhibition and propagation-domain-containing protein [Auriculariales sp. MPI-PUGE-AT-0066]
MEPTGLAVGIVALWETCVKLFEAVSAAREYGIDYEILVTKLEVERVRLLLGDAVGLVTRPGAPSQNARLGRPEVRDAVVRLLGCIQHVFEDSERLQNAYGLRPCSVPEMLAAQAVAAQEMNDSLVVPPSQNQMILGGVFRRAYERLRQKADVRQRDTTMTRKSKWRLESLFPGVRAMVVRAMQDDVDESVEIRELHTLQEATAGDMDAISERASMRLEALGATVSARTELLSAHRDILAEEDETGEEKAIGEDQEGVKASARARKTGTLKILKEAELYVDFKNMGTLVVRVLGANSVSARCTAWVSWEGQMKDELDVLTDHSKGFVPMVHTSFDMYKKKSYMWKQDNRLPDSEDCVLLDPEAHIKFENVIPGTVTVEGFALECWDYERQERPRDHIIFINRSTLPGLTASQLLCRVNELQTNPGTFGNTYNARGNELEIGDFYSLLNRTDIFADFCETSSAGEQWAILQNENGIGTWKFLRQIVIAWELAARLKHHRKDISWSGFTDRILATMIISDLWLKNVRIILVDRELVAAEQVKSEADLIRAEAFKAEGNNALTKGDPQKAVDLYTEAVKLDIGNAIYRCNRAAAYMALELWRHAEEDALIAVQLDAEYAKAWSRVGMARLKQGHAKRARDAYQSAIRIAGSQATPQMRKGLADAEANIRETVKVITTEKDVAKQHAMIAKWDAQDFDVFMKQIQPHSQVHAQQVEGLMLFAQKMRWPYINELRNYAEDVYAELRGGATIDIHLHDWLFGVILPGKWFAFKIMTALVQCTPSLESQVGIAPYYECGLSLPTRSYWRSRTVLGRVLGCCPGVQSHCGWIGPCPAVEFEALENKPRFVRVKARRTSPQDYKPDINDRDKVYNYNSVENAGSYARLQSNEEIEPYLAEMKDPSLWIVPEPPVQDMSTCQLKAIKLRRFPLDPNTAVKVARGGTNHLEIESEAEYRATLEFALDDKPGHVVSYKLFTNPVFIAPPPCRAGPKGHHEVHIREISRYQRNIWTIDKLQDHTAEDDEEQDEADGGVMTINATGKGAELLARAWCAERGKNAVIRRAESTRMSFEKPAWLLQAATVLQQRFPHDTFAVVPRAAPAAAEDHDMWRVKCADCPGKVRTGTLRPHKLMAESHTKLYHVGPNESLENFSVHLRNRVHRRAVHERMNIV